MFDKPLFRAAFHDDVNTAKANAVKWFEETHTDNIQYHHHRLIAAVGQRFGDAPELQAHSQMISNVSKQLWMRGIQAIRSLDPLTKHLSVMRVPWAFTGNAFWHGMEAQRFSDCELLEVIVHPDAFPYVILHFWRSGWTPPAGIDIYDRRKPVFFNGPDGKKMILRSSAELHMASPRKSDDSIWASVTHRDVYQMPLRFLSLECQFKQTVQRDIKDEQWLVDFCEIHNRDADKFNLLCRKLGRWNRKVRVYNNLRN